VLQAATVVLPRQVPVLAVAQAAVDLEVVALAPAVAPAAAAAAAVGAAVAADPAAAVAARAAVAVAARAVAAVVAARATDEGRTALGRVG
jgi:hypothetical protein